MYSKSWCGKKLALNYEKRDKQWHFEFTWITVSSSSWDFFAFSGSIFLIYISTFARVNKYHSGPHGDSKVLSKENGPQIFRGNGLRELTFFLIPLKLLRCRIQTYWYRVQLETVRLFFGTVKYVCNPALQYREEEWLNSLSRLELSVV